MEDVTKIAEGLAGVVKMNPTTMGITTGTVNGGYTVGSIKISDNNNWSGTGYVNCWPNYSWWPTYWPTYYEDKYAKAFRVVKSLLDQKVIKLRKIDQFIEVVDKIAAVI